MNRNVLKSITSLMPFTCGANGQITTYTCWFVIHILHSRNISELEQNLSKFKLVLTAKGNFAKTVGLFTKLLKLKFNFWFHDIRILWRLLFFSISRFPTVYHDEECFVIDSIRWIFTTRRSASLVTEV